MLYKLDLVLLVNAPRVRVLRSEQVFGRGRAGAGGIRGKGEEFHTRDAQNRIMHHE